LNWRGWRRSCGRAKGMQDDSEEGEKAMGKAMGLGDSGETEDTKTHYDMHV